MEELLIATHNAHKTHEFRRMLGHRYKIIDLTTVSGIEPAEETGDTFADNARLKAFHVSRHLPDRLVLADDSGLEVSALGGAPGVLSARFAGDAATDAENRRHLLDQLRAAGSRGKERRAQFRCVLILARGDSLIACVEGTVDGHIGVSERGRAGFGYDPLFIPDGYCQTFAELPPETKNRISHRARALKALFRALP